MGKLCLFCCFGMGVALVLLIAGCGGSSNSDPGSVQIVSGDALNPQANALARRRRIAGETLKVLFDGDRRPDHQVPVADVIDVLTTTAGTHLVEFALENQRGQVFATGRQQAPVLLSTVQITELVFDAPDCGPMSGLTCQTPATVTPAVVLADAETEQCVSVAESISPVRGLSICVPPGVLEEDTTVVVTEVYNLPSGVPDHVSQAGVMVEIRFDPEPFFSQPITLEFPYDEALVATEVQNLGLNEAELALFQLNSRAGQWAPLPGQAPPNTNADMITAQSNSSGFFVVGGPLPDAGNPPVANRQVVTTFVNTSVPITLTGSDADGNPLIFRVVSMPARGELARTANVTEEDGVLEMPEGTALVYTPDANFFGRDTLLFEVEEVSAAGLSSVLATVTILVDPLQSLMGCASVDLTTGDTCRGASPVDVAVVDLNGDHRLDWITANEQSNDISILLGQDDLSVSQPQRFAVGSRERSTPAALVVTDFDDDGTPDVAVVNRQTSEVALLLLQHSGDSFFVEQLIFPVDGAPSDLAVGDVNNDMVPDLVTANFDFSNVSVLLGQRVNNAFMFEPRQSYNVGAKPRAVAVADVNNDGCLDILTANTDASDSGPPANNITVLIGQCDGSFPFLRDPGLPVGEEPLGLAVGDLNDDGFLDLVTANHDSDDVSILLGQGDALFAPERRFPVGRMPRQVAIADLNADDKLDVATANSGTDNVSVLLGLGDGTLLVEQGYGVGDKPLSLAVADINLDGTLDLVTVDQLSNTVSALFGEGDGTFPAAQGYGVGARPQAVAADDLDSDGRLDLVTANASSDDVSVLLRQFKGSFVTVLNVELSDGALGPHDVVIADLENGDAVLDMVTANAGVEVNPSTTVSTLFGVRPAGFRVENFDADSMRQGAVAVGDLNGDTLPDLVTASLGTAHEPANRVYVLISQGLERYELLHAPAIQVDTGPQDVELGDFSGDGVLDLVTANANADTVSVILGRSNGNFNVASRRDIAVGRRPVAVAIEDLNNDGRFDLVTANADDHNVSVLFGQGNGNFVPADPPEFAAGIGPSDVAVDHLAGVLGGGCAPGLYVVTANANSNNVAVLKVRESVGGITLAAPQFFSVGIRPISVQVADFNADGRPDLITANEDSDNVSVLLQRGSADGECLFTP